MTHMLTVEPIARQYAPAIKFVRGDLLNMQDIDVIVHGCNCFNTMGAGFAKNIAARYPSIKVDDSNTQKGDYDKLGTFGMIGVTPFLTVINAYTQYDYGNDGKDRFNYLAFQLILGKLKFFFGEEPTRFGFPLIGMNNAGGDPIRIFKILNTFAMSIAGNGSTVTVVEYDK